MLHGSVLPGSLAPGGDPLMLQHTAAWVTPGSLET
jgi:hypothetical protein